MARVFLSRLWHGLHRIPSRAALLTSGAAAASVVLARLLGPVDAVNAAIAAVVSVRMTFHETAAGAVRSTMGTAFGAFAGLFALHTWGTNPAVLLVSLLATYAVSAILRLGEAATVSSAVAVVIVVSGDATVDASWRRLAGVALGSVVALIASYWVSPGKPTDRALQSSAEDTKRMAGLLERAGRAIAAGQGLAEAKKWEARAEQLLAASASHRSDARSAEAAARWTPTLNQGQATAVRRQVSAWHGLVRTVFAGLQDLSAGQADGVTFTAEEGRLVGDTLVAAAQVMRTQVSRGAVNPGVPLDPRHPHVGEYRQRAQRLKNWVASRQAERNTLLAAALLRDTDRILGQVSRDRTSPQEHTGPIPIVSAPLADDAASDLPR